MAQTIYADVATVTDDVYDAIDESGTTDASVIAHVNESAKQASGELEAEFIYLISDTVPFTTPFPDWFRELANKLTEAYFWNKQNGDTKMLEAMEKRIQRERNLRFNQVQTIIRG
jgi:hypothetical protein